MYGRNDNTRDVCNAFSRFFLIFHVGRVKELRTTSASSGASLRIARTIHLVEGIARAYVTRACENERSEANYTPSCAERDS